MVELADNALFYIAPQPLDEGAQKLLNEEGLEILKLMESYLAALPESRWSEHQLENYAREIAEEKDLKLGKVAQPLRAALTGSTVSPSVFDILHVLGKDQSLERIRTVLNGASK
ncbi:MAG: glutamate--tRNA ligase, partial [Alphaproteobacteria bacterium]|nr:glutamate--tRNA ligase [Alphaproteobacteria bacterium]